MKRLLPIVLLLLAGIITVCSAGPGGGGRKRLGGYDDLPKDNPQADYWVVWRRFKMSTDELLKTLGATNAEAASLLQQIQTSVHYLDDKWDVWFKQHKQAPTYSTHDDYLTSLRADLQLLTNAKKEKDATKALGLVRDAALDMQIKADNCRHSSDGLGKEIRVKVHTKAGDQEIGGYEVYFVSKGMFDVKSAHDRFPRQSSPTDEKILCPGGYAMWARKKNFTSEPITLRIGGRGETKIEVDIPVPAE